MIDELVKQHDKYSAEIKVGFEARKRLKINEFSFNIWLFIPNSLDINRFSYSKTDFYKDLKSNIRLITPVYQLRQIIWKDNSPLSYLQKSFKVYIAQPTRLNSEECEYQLKMFISILKSSLRDEVNHIGNSRNPDCEYLIQNFSSNVRAIFDTYRELFQIINIPKLDERLRNSYAYSEEFLCNVIEKYCFLLLKVIKKKESVLYDNHKESILNLINHIVDYKKSRGYGIVEEDSDGSKDFVYRLGLLKKYAESHLYLNVKKRKDGVLTEQIMYSMAAGISMIFATIIAFSVQQKFGNYTMPLFVALVVSYMLKDRIKEMSRYYFAHKMGSKYFDHKFALNINNTDIGWAKESMDFITDSKVPNDVLKARGRAPIIDAIYRKESEKVILYRVNMHIDRDKLNMISPYYFSGVNSILRFNTYNFLRNMDNPDFPLFLQDDNEGLKVIKGKKFYYINLIIQKRNENQNDLKKYRIVLNKDGIQKIEAI